MKHIIRGKWGTRPSRTFGHGELGGPWWIQGVYEILVDGMVLPRRFYGANLLVNQIVIMVSRKFGDKVVIV